MNVPPSPDGHLELSHDRPRPMAHAVLRLIWQQRRISRADIARRADLSRSTVSEAINALLPTGLIAETGTAPSRGGRRPILLEFQDEAFCLIGVEVGAAHVGVALTDLRGRVRLWLARDHAVRDDPTGTRELVRRLCEEALERVPGARETLVGLGVAMPCPVDPSDLEHLSEVVLPAWKGKSGLSALGEHFGVPIFVDNDANAGAMAERWWGAGRGVRDFAYIKIATGVGSGHVMDGRLYRGASGVAGEIGHVAIDPQGKPCVCGLRGCLTTLVGQAALVDRLAELGSEYPESLLQPQSTIRDLEDAAMQNDALALRVVEEAAEYLGIAIASMLNLLNPAAVIVGGDMARLGELLLRPLRETVAQRTLVSSVNAAEVRTSELGPRSVAVGAATLVLEAALEDPSLFPDFHPQAEAARR